MTAKSTRLRRISEGVCCGCGACPPVPGKLQCESCLKVQADQYRSWRERSQLLDAEQRTVIESLRAISESVDGIEDEPDDEPTALMVAHKEVVKVTDGKGSPILAVLPWGAYLKLLTASREAKGRKRTERRPIKYRKHRGRQPIPNGHILKSMIRDHPESSADLIAARFLEQTGQVVHRNTVLRYRKELETPRVISGTSSPVPALNINGNDLSEYSAMILEAAIRAGVRPQDAAESEEYADGLVALYEAAEDFDSKDHGHFPPFVQQRIKSAITRGREDRRLKVNSRRVRNFSEISDEDFDFASIIEDKGRA